MCIQYPSVQIMNSMCTKRCLGVLLVVYCSVYWHWYIVHICYTLPHVPEQLSDQVTLFDTFLSRIQLVGIKSAEHVSLCFLHSRLLFLLTQEIYTRHPPEARWKNCTHWDPFSLSGVKFFTSPSWCQHKPWESPSRIRSQWKPVLNLQHVLQLNLQPSVLTTACVGAVCWSDSDFCTGCAAACWPAGTPGPEASLDKGCAGWGWPQGDGLEGSCRPLLSAGQAFYLPGLPPHPPPDRGHSSTLRTHRNKVAQASKSQTT